MTGAPDIPWHLLALALLLVAIPLGVSWKLRLGMHRDILVGITRMSVQLILAGLYLGILFRWKAPLLTLAWLGVMIAAASGSLIHNSALQLRTFIVPAFFSLGVATLAMVLFFNGVILRLDRLLEARYLIVLSGMLLGNCLGANVVAASRFYQSLADGRPQYEYALGNGASQWTALRPFVQETFLAAMRPGIAGMMTMGLVSLPGMMTGQMLGGSSPMVAIKYQIAIMIAIFTCTVTSISLFLYTSARLCFDAYGMPEFSRIFKKSQDRSTTATSA